ncbi:hypothetical protein HNO92_001408 [Chromobacterium alkanivorans]|uniref:hypothetical protein n=1 Tax=Chromobacterium alkanivorans TaxID=1071719 RepID=UPI00216A4EB4|nr:hypothetical protein [Chromobacterium alkanivorans]MCS3804692.1 hypothetical protein [Chromobacterium alkanivorans]MCS3819032.1 hypothetical protein [Chromobacterium alkanivorans]MCS3873111.1 hypothetical protein [Chromobacterium alkanivorans]
MSAIRVLVPDDDQSKEAISLAFDYADKLCKLSQGAVQEAILFVPGKNSIKFTTLTSVLGEMNAKKLHDGGIVILPSGIPMRLETIRTLRWAAKSSVLISIYSDQKMLDQVDSTKNLFGIVAVPHVPDALEMWQKTWSPTVHGAPKQSPQKLIEDLVVEQALVSLTHSINLSHSLLNPCDKKYSDRTLRILRANGHVEEPVNLRLWAVQNGWHPKAAEELEKLAIKILSLKSTPRLPDPDVAKRTYDYWCSKI